MERPVHFQVFSLVRWHPQEGTQGPPVGSELLLGFGQSDLRRFSLYLKTQVFDVALANASARDTIGGWLLLQIRDALPGLANRLPSSQDIDELGVEIVNCKTDGVLELRLQNALGSKSHQRPGSSFVGKVQRVRNVNIVLRLAPGAFG